MSDQAEIERDMAARFQGAVGQEGTGKTKYTERIPGPYNDMLDATRERLRGIDFSFVYGIGGGDQVDRGRTRRVSSAELDEILARSMAAFDVMYGKGIRKFGKSRPLPSDDTIECTDYTELPEEQLLLPSGEEAEDG